jgi:transcriptional regulator with XRE-family HTH domain
LATLNPQRVELGRLLGEARAAAGVDADRVASELRWYKQKVARVESGQRVPTGAELDRLADLYAIPEEQRDSLHVLADAARKREAPARVADFAQSFVTFERAATQIRYYDAELVYGLLQTPDYARVLLAIDGADDVDGRVADRMQRQRILGVDTVPDLRVILGEAALHRRVGGADVLKAQLEHLLRMGQRPNINLRVLPFEVGAHPAIGVGFTHLRLTAPSITRVYIEGLTDATYIADPEETAVYERSHDRLWPVALDERASASIIRRHIGNN